MHYYRDKIGVFVRFSCAASEEATFSTFFPIVDVGYFFHLVSMMRLPFPESCSSKLICQ
jgi:hypothetical protein